MVTLGREGNGHCEEVAVVGGRGVIGHLLFFQIATTGLFCLWYVHAYCTIHIKQSNVPKLCPKAKFHENKAIEVHNVCCMQHIAA